MMATDAASGALGLLARPGVLAAAVLTLGPLLWAGFFPESWLRLRAGLPRAARLSAPAVLCLPYLLVALSLGGFRWGWLGVYALLPVAIAGLMEMAAAADAERLGHWADFAVLGVLGLAVDLRWFEAAWPAGLSAFGKMLLLDAGIYGFLVVRGLDGVGFDLRLRWRDLGIGLREFAFYTPVALALGLRLGFLHFHAEWPSAARAAGAYLYTFFFIAVPEEIFFRGWLQNLLERRMGMLALEFAGKAERLENSNERQRFGAKPGTKKAGSEAICCSPTLAGAKARPTYQQLAARLKSCPFTGPVFFRRWESFSATLFTSLLFGLAHWNKRALHFNWRYVVLAAIAGVFYGRAWRAERRVGAAAITHATVDWVWSLWLR